MSDLGLESFSHVAEWSFQIADDGSNTYGYSVGKLKVNVPTN